MRKKSGVNIRDIAAELDLNISTVSRALNGSFLISRETTELVQHKAHEMGYQFQRMKKNIVILLPSSDSELAWYSINLINALQNRLRQTAYRWEFITEDNIDLIQERSIAGMISLVYLPHVFLKISAKYNIALVCINNTSRPSDNVYSVNSDAVNAVSKAFNCLVEYGHKNIAFASQNGGSYAEKNRQAAFVSISKKYGLQNSCFVVSAKVDNCHGIVLDLYKKGVTGIITDGESAGLKIWNSLNFCKIDVPRQMSLIAWEIPHVSGMVSPAITTVEQDFSQLAGKALQLLENRWNNDRQMSDIQVPYLLHLRDTVSIPRMD
ncbi:MAG: LacI family DNA-binding transcriptional regulator [Lentisphaeria bacterium]|nr:LacI family DNA-binding transcriptional regulator [Lentisphaeria bacterium]